ncbi:MAG: gliding motility-associated ABC transporter ATP-binding subunit GldA [Flavobacteriia bacterium]|nr:MAG: gliding motility-associated ABC transporter ATP-binding subunit GldA [Flavobacteriia bacterium]
MSIRVEHLSKSYNGKKAVDDISFFVDKGEITGFLGPNGAGKSTVMKILTNYIKDFEGDVFINERSVREQPIETQLLTGYLPEHNPLYPEMYVREYLEFTAGMYQTDLSAVPDIITRVGLDSHAHKRIKALSKGYRQRVGLAAAMLHHPEVLILDEPTTGLDPNQLAEIRALIKAEGADKTVLFSTHIMQEVEAICDRVIILNQGKIVADSSIADLKQGETQVIEVAFDLKIESQFLQQIEHLESVENVFDTTWLLTFKTQEDCRAIVFDFAKSHDLKILNMTMKNQGLEALFKSLTNA